MFDYSKLRGKIKEVIGTETRFAILLGISRTSLSDKLNNKAEFTQGEIDIATKILKIRADEISEYFFNNKIQKSELEG